MERLTHNTTYYVGDFILRVSENGTLRVTTDRGKVLICPKADNAVELKSSRGTFIQPYFKKQKDNIAKGDIDKLLDELSEVQAKKVEQQRTWR